MPWLKMKEYAMNEVTAWSVKNISWPNHAIPSTMTSEMITFNQCLYVYESKHNVHSYPITLLILFWTYFLVSSGDDKL